MKNPAVPTFHMPAAQETSLVTAEDEGQLMCQPGISNGIRIERRRDPCDD